MRKQTKIAALVSAAALLAIGASMTASAAAAGWYPQEDGTYIYLDKNGNQVYGEWHRDASGDRTKVYFAGYDGIMVKDEPVPGDNGELYYVDSTGARVYDQWVYITGEQGQEEGYYYFDEKTGRAVSANLSDPSLEYVARSVRKSSTDATKGLFVFNTSGVMQTGWVDRVYVSNSKPAQTFYCVQEADGYTIAVEGDFNYVEGEALQGWANMPVRDDVINSTGAIDGFGYCWYYFRNDGIIKATSDPVITASLSWNGVSGTYYFDADGVMMDSASYNVTTPATGSVSAGIYMNVDHAAGSGNKWVYDDGWYYVVNLKDSKGATISSGKGVKFNDDDKDFIRVKSINGQLYAFGDDGKMLTGAVYITQEMEALYVAEGWKEASTGTLPVDPKWNGVAYKGLHYGWYYFNDPDQPTASTAGRMLKNVKKSNVDDDGDTHTRYYTGSGRAAQDAVWNNFLYDDDCDLVLPEEGSSYEIYVLEKDTVVKKGSTAQTLKLDAGTRVIINRNGSLVTSGQRVIDDVTWVVSGYKANIK